MTRTYASAARAHAARETRQRILAAAYTLLVADGYPSLSMAALGKAAGVSPQTIYNSVGAKAQVLKACYDVTLAGDDEAVAMNDRPELRAILRTPSADAFVTAYARWCRTIYERVGALLGAVLRPGTTADAGAAEFAATIEIERRKGTAHALAGFEARFGLPDGLAPDRAVDAVWTLNSPEVFDRLVRRCGWTPQAYEDWLAGQLRAALSVRSVAAA